MQPSSGGLITVDLADSIVSAGTCGSIISNDGSDFSANNLVVRQVDASALISTANGGNSFLTGSLVEDSGLDAITSASGTGAQGVANVVVQNMRRMAEAFLVTGAGSTLSMSGVSIIDNVIESTRWSGVVVRSGALANVDTFTFARNTRVGFALSSVDVGASLYVSNSMITDNTGTDDMNSISAAVLALQQATVVLERTQLSGNNGFSVSMKGGLELVAGCRLPFDKFTHKCLSFLDLVFCPRIDSRNHGHSTVLLREWIRQVLGLHRQSVSVHSRPKLRQ